MQVFGQTNVRFFDGKDVFDGEPSFWTSDAEARQWVREARVEELRQRTGYYTAAQLDKVGCGIAGGWADGDPVPDHESDIVVWVEQRQEYRLLQDGEEVDRQDAREAAEARWCRRDEIDAWVEAKRRTEGDQSRVDGDYWGAGPVAEKRWLDAQIAQLRIEARELVADGRRKGFKVNPLTDPQVAAIARQARSLRWRHNFKRYVEALKCDPEQGGADFAEQFEKAQAWRREQRLSYEKATVRLAQIHRRRWIKGDENWIGVEGLIAV
jgi:hypothetical protein